MEPWLESLSHPCENPRVADISVGLDQVLYLLEQTLSSIPEEYLWNEPAPGIPSIGARVQHIIGSSSRLYTYAYDSEADPQKLARDAVNDWVPGGYSAKELISRLKETFDQIKVSLFNDEDLDAICPIGRKKIPVRRSTVLHHIVEHAAHHTGQIILLARWWKNQVTEKENS